MCRRPARRSPDVQTERRLHVVTQTPEEIEDAERAEFWRLTQEALRQHPEALDEDRALWDRTLMDGLEED